MKSLAAVGLFAVLAFAASAAQAGEVTYRTHISELFRNHCAACHGPDSAPEHADFKENKSAWESKGKGPRMDTYSHLISYIGWPDSGAIMRRLDDGSSTKDGKPGNMYQHLGSTDEERARNLAVFKAWVGNWTLKRWKDMTKEDLEDMKLKY